jgi:penicillin-binding protein 2
LGKPLGIDLEGEVSGTVPSPQWKKKEIGETWYLGDTYHYGIGQGFLLTTPLQVNGFTQAISNRGVLYQPHLLKDQNAKIVSQNSLDEKNLDLIRQGMIEACSPGGVAWPLFDFKVKNPNLKIDGKNFLEAPQATASADFKDYRKVAIACKTGTAQHGGDQTLPHAWITLFAPAYDPQIVVTVLSEESGEGSNVAAPIAKKILESYFGNL